jgi:RimJ/RimL family protein N-acetyltransferase
MRPFAPALLEGRHVRLEPLSPGHVAALARAATIDGRETFAWTSVPDDPEGMRAYVEAALADQRAGLAVPFATVAAGEVVGSTRFGNAERWTWPPGSPHQRPAGCIDAVEIGWTWLAPRAQRTAVNTEAKLLMLGHAFEVWQARRVTLKTDARNARSRAAIERAGARLDGLLRAHMPAADDTPRTSAVYSILAAEWPAARERLARALVVSTT